MEASANSNKVTRPFSMENMDAIKPVFKDLLRQQINVMKAISYLAIVFVSVLIILFKFLFDFTQFLPAIVFPVFIVLLNVLLFPLHKKAYLMFFVLIFTLYIELMVIACITGGLYSPLLFILVMFPSFAFYTSKRQGKIWFFICLLSVFILYNANSFGITVSDIISYNFRTYLLLTTIIFSLILLSSYQLLVKQDAITAHKRHTENKLNLKEIAHRLENEEMLVNYCDELMCVINIEDLTFVQINSAFKILLGYELIELKGQPIGKIFKDDYLSTLSREAESQRLSFESEMLYKNGRVKLFKWIVKVKNGKLYAYGRNITDTNLG